MKKARLGFEPGTADESTKLWRPLSTEIIVIVIVLDQLNEPLHFVTSSFSSTRRLKLEPLAD